MKVWLGGLTICGLALTACSDSTSELETQIAALQTHVGALQTQLATTPTPNAAFQAFITQALAATPEPAPDRVVGIEWRCAAITNNGTPPADFHETGCKDRTPTTNYLIINRRQVLTVRTALGTTYVIAEPPETVVTLGQVWPPAQ